MTMHQDLRIERKHNKPYGIRDRNSYLFFFAEVIRFADQNERYQQELVMQEELALYLLTALQKRQKIQQ